MNLKSIIQIFLIFLILIISYLFYYNYFKKKNDDFEVDKIEKLEDTKILEENIENVDASTIKDLEYKSTDKKGNEYIVNAKFGEINLKDSNIIILKDVTGKINIIGKSSVDIKSDFAKYNSSNLDTEFYQKVTVKYEENFISSDNLDFFFKDNIATIYNNAVFNNNLSEVEADKIDIDLLTGNIDINMFEDSDKINILKK